MEKELEKLREKIDNIDEKLIELLNNRAEIVLDVGKVKDKSLKNYFAPARQVQILQRLKEKSNGPYPPEAIDHIFTAIFSSSIALESQLQIAYFGDAGSFTHQAAITKFGPALTFKPFHTIQDVFEAVKKKWVEFGVVPIENSNGGIVNHTLDMFLEYDLKIVSEQIINIEHNLISQAADLSDIKRIYSHPQALTQCRNWVKAHLPEAELIEVAHTSEGVVRANESAENGAIGSQLSSELFHVPILKHGIQDFTNNQTKFLVIGKKVTPPAAKNKTSLMVSLSDKVGALFEVLSLFKIYDISLSRIESRPSKRRPWEYIFFIDFLGHVEERLVKSIMKDLEEKCNFVKLLGSYPINPMENE